MKTAKDVFEATVWSLTIIALGSTGYSVYLAFANPDFVARALFISLCAGLLALGGMMFAVWTGWVEEEDE